MRDDRLDEAVRAVHSAFGLDAEEERSSTAAPALTGRQTGRWPAARGGGESLWPLFTRSRVSRPVSISCDEWC